VDLDEPAGRRDRITCRPSFLANKATCRSHHSAANAR
jgi:hypothetical protein